MVRFYGNEIDGGAEGIGVINVTPDATPAGSTEITTEQRMAQLKAEREGRVIAAAQARADSNPMLDPTNRPDAPPADDEYVYYYGWIGSAATGQWKLYKESKSAPEYKVNAAEERAQGGSTQANFLSAVGANTLSSGSTVSTTPTTVTTTPTTPTTVTTTPTTPTTVTTTSTIVTTTPTTVTTTPTTVTATPTGMTSGQQDIYSIVVDRLNRYNLGSLAPLIKKLAIEGATEATIMLRLQEEPLYQERFKANQARISKGIKALTPSEYLTLEDDYRQVLRAYGLTQFDNDAYVSQFLANDISVSELSNRVVSAVQRVRNADPAVSSMLRNYYGIGQNDLVAYVLDPNQQFQKIERQIAASEIGVAAGRQGFNIGVPVAEQLAAQGITQAEAQRGYATIADILPTAQKLSDIYGNTLEGYDLAQAEQEMFNQLASAQRKRQRLVGREVAEFSGQSGLARGGLAETTQRGQF